MSKGSARRPTALPADELARKWAETFPPRKKPPEPNLADSSELSRNDTPERETNHLT